MHGTGRYLACAFLGMVTACGGSSPTAVGCTRELGVALTPREPTIHVGETVSPDLQLSGCGGRELLEADWHLAGDAAAVDIGADARSFTAVQAGQATLAVVDARYGKVGEIRVSVVDAH